MKFVKVMFSQVFVCPQGLHPGGPASGGGILHTGGVCIQGGQTEQTVRPHRLPLGNLPFFGWTCNFLKCLHIHTTQTFHRFNKIIYYKAHTTSIKYKSSCEVTVNLKSVPHARLPPSLVCCLQAIERDLTRPPLRYYGIRSTSGRYASYWNAFLLIFEQ